VCKGEHGEIIHRSSAPVADTRLREPSRNGTLVEHRCVSPIERGHRPNSSGFRLCDRINPLPFRTARNACETARIITKNIGIGVGPPSHSDSIPRSVSGCSGNTWSAAGCPRRSLGNEEKPSLGPNRKTSMWACTRVLVIHLVSAVTTVAAKSSSCPQTGQSRQSMHRLHAGPLMHCTHGVPVTQCATIDLNQNVPGTS
jgi:hypothetical protein